MSNDRWGKSLIHAIEGVAHCLKTQRNMRIHAIMAVIACGLGLYVGLSLVEWAILVIIIAIVFITETLNTAIETVVDLVTPEYNPLAKIAKDVAAGAVLMAACTSLIVGILLFCSRIFF